MKRLFALLICIIMVLSLTACGNKESTDATAQTTDEAQTQTPDEAQAYTPAGKFEFGSIFGTSYNNNSIGIGISLPSDFTVLSTQELAKMNKFDEKLMTENLPKAMENTLRAYTFVAMDNAGSYMNIIVENLRIPNRTYIFGYEYFSIYSEEIKKEIEDMGGTDITLTPSKVTIAGTQYDVELISYTLDGASMSETRIAFPAGEFIAIMTMKGDIELMLNRIYGL